MPYSFLVLWVPVDLFSFARRTTFRPRVVPEHTCTNFLLILRARASSCSVRKRVFISLFTAIKSIVDQEIP